MKIIASTFVLCFLSIITIGQSTHHGIPIIKASYAKADYRVGNDWVKNSWSISQYIAADTLIVPCTINREVFVFYTDRDSISFKLTAGDVHKFYVALNDTTFALTVVKTVNPNYQALRFDEKSKNEAFPFWYEQNNNNPYLQLLRSKFPIDSLMAEAKNDTEKALRILHWVHSQWQHNGSNNPKKNDAVSILEEAKEGKNFRCVEYGIVSTACLNAAGLKARVLALKSKDVETRQYGAGHVLLEVYLNDLQKWALADGQWDAMPVLNGIPLNAVEFQQAIAENYIELEIKTSSGTSKRFYINWIYPYLHYFDISFDNREGANIDKMKIDGKKCLMLVPPGEKNPVLFQITKKIDYCLYTNSLKDFYAPPSDHEGQK
jgi:hypothetical protein